MANKKDSDSTCFWLPTTNTTKMDVLTPHKLSIVFLIQEYLQLKTSATDNDNTLITDFTPTYRKQFCMLLLKLIQYPDMPYKELHILINSQQYKLHPKHLEGFENLMKILHQLGIEVFFDLQSLIDKLMSEQAFTVGGVSSYGIVGLYLRRVHVTLDKMTFPELMCLYKNTLLYFEKGMRSLALSSNNSANIADSHFNEPSLIKDRTSHCKWSIKQAELFVAQQSALMQNNETCALSPKEMQLRLNEIILDNPLYTQAYFLSYMNNIRIRDVFNSLDTLHRSFDRSTLKTILSTVNDSKDYQYSSLNLAILHTQFNHKNEALASLRECIMLAQENGDRVCLQLAQSWLCLLDNNKLQISEKNISNKTQFILVHSISMNIQSLIKCAAISGYLPSKLFEVLLKSDILNCQHSMMDLIANCITERAALWSLYGKYEISSLCSQLLLNSNLKTLGKSYSGEGICQSLCNLAIWIGQQGEYNMAALLLQNARERFPRYPISRTWMIADCLITVQQAQHRCQWEDGFTACCKLYTLDKNLSMLLRASLNIARGNTKAAQHLLQSLLESKKSNIEQNEEETSKIEPLIHVRAMILLANTLIIDNYSEKISPEMIGILNQVFILAKDKYLDYELSIIELNLANVQLQIGLSQQALRTIKISMENVLSNGGIYDKAKTMFLFLKCLMATTPTTDVKEKCQKLEECDDIIKTILQQFTKLECHTKVRDVYLYLAKLYHSLDVIEKRNYYAMKFRQIDEEFPHTKFYANIFF